MKVRLLSILVVAASLSSPALADWDRGGAAFEQQDYATAVREFRAAAEHGDARAQNFLGMLYFNGAHVPRDYAEAARWFRAAAEQGSSYPQYKLGQMYANGQGLPRDYVQAYIWTSIATARGSKIARTNLESIEGRMTQQQIAEAQRLAAEAWERINR